MVLAGAGVAAAVAAAGCGGSGGQSAAEYRQKAEAICTEMNQAIETQQAPRTAAEYGPYLDRLLATIDPALRKLDALEPPSDLRPRHEQALRLAHRGIALLHKVADGLHAGQSPVVLAQAYGRRADRLIARANVILRRLDLPACAANPQPRNPPPPA